MHEVLQFLRLEGSRTEVLPVWEALLAITVAYVCSLIVGMVYRWTHRAVGYSPAYTQTLVLVSMVTALIMIVIGSNIARAFSLVGALSIIRFRNAIKETRDVGYIFFAMAAAMAAGTRFYTLAFAATALISLYVLLVDYFGFGSRAIQPERLLKVRLTAGVDPLTILEPTFETLFSSWSIVMLETTQQGLSIDAVFSVRRLDKVSPADVINSVQALDGNPKVTYHLGLDAQEV